jgi:hypothetical protein
MTNVRGGLPGGETRTEYCMDLNFSKFEWYVSKRVSLYKTASLTGVCTRSALLNVDGNVEYFVEKYPPHIPPVYGRGRLQRESLK